ncbi:protein FAM114A2-like [Diadema antillarum]|uniref:protein FAM114A2-like n=1 Tax=Diadema antillarum TaxID=105358 RepID=UPI003A8AD911
MEDTDSEVSFESADEGDEDVQKGEATESSEKSDAPQGAMSAGPAADDIKEQDTQKSGGAAGRTKQEETSKEQIKDSKAQADIKSEVRDEGGEKESEHSTLMPSPDTSEAKDAESKTGAETDEAVKEEEEKQKRQEEPVAEEIRDRGAAGDVRSDAMSGGTPQHATAGAGSGGWGWGGWGSSILSSAAATVTKVSDNVGKGLTSVLENVESTLGVPKPEELREIAKKEKEKEQVADIKEPALSGGKTSNRYHSADKASGGAEEGESGGKEETGEEQREGAGIGGLFSFGASAFTNVMEKTVTGGLDALEMIGRKTMDILQEGDPRLEKKRALIVPRSEKVNLSEVLRQAKEEAEAEAKRRQEEEDLQKFNFGLLFDQFQGLAHLEALEMLSNQSETKVQSAVATVTEDTLDEVKTELLEVRDAFQLEDVDTVEEDATNDQDFVNVVTELLFSLSIAATPDKLQRVQKEAKEWLSTHKVEKDAPESSGGDGGEDSKLQIQDVHAKAMQVLAELTARTIEQFHKVAELMLLDQDQSKGPVERATTLSKLASILSAEVSSIATRFCEMLSSMGDQSQQPEEVNTIITNIYLEASNSTSYIQDAFQLLLPVLQDIAVRRRSEEVSS